MNIFFSAFLYGIAFAIPSFWWTIFFFLVPLLWIKQLTWMQGFFWGIISFCIHSHELFFVSLNEGVGFGSVLMPVALIVLLALYAGCWLWAIEVIGKKNIGIWLVCTIVFFYTIHTFVMWPIGKCEGYPFTIPLLPLAVDTRFFSMINHFGLWGLTFCLVGFQTSVAFAYKKKKLSLIFCACCFSLPFIFGFIFDNDPLQEKDPIECGALCIRPSNQFNHPYGCGHDLCIQLMLKLTCYPKTKVIFSPEGAFPFFYQDHAYWGHTWDEWALDGRPMIFGSYRKENNKSFNTIFFIQKGRIVFSCDKTHLVPAFEEPINIFNIKKPYSPYLYKRKVLCCGSKTNPCFQLPVFGICMPIICSELFWQFLRQYPSSVRGVNTYIAFVADHYFPFSSSFSRLMLGSAKLIACIMRTRLLYISYHYFKLFKSSF